MHENLAVVTLERPTEHIALVTIRRPNVRNCVDGEVTDRLARIVAETNSDDTLRAVILTGEGDRAFCAGADLKEVDAGRFDALFTADGGFAGFVHARKVKPWIAAINGPAVAGGFELALACDMIVASQRATFGLPEVKRGLIAAAGGIYRLPRSLPRTLALELICTGGALDAHQALRHGLINRVVEHGSVVDQAIALAQEIAQNAPLAVQASLGIARQAFDLPGERLADLSDEGLNRIRQTEDFQEGPRAFLEKRQPIWRAR